MSFEVGKIQYYEYEYDFADDGGATGTIDLSAKANKADLPNGCVRLRTSVVVQTALAGSSASAKIGTSANAADLAADAGVASYSASAVFNDTTPVYIGTTNGDCVLTIAGAALTAGKFKVLVEFWNPNA